MKAPGYNSTPADDRIKVEAVNAAIVALGTRVIEAFRIIDGALDIDPAVMPPELMRETMRTAASILAAMGPSIRTIGDYVTAHSAPPTGPVGRHTLDS